MEYLFNELTGPEVVLLAVGMIILAVTALAVMIYYLITKWTD